EVRRRPAGRLRRSRLRWGCHISLSFSMTFPCDLEDATLDRTDQFLGTRLTRRCSRGSSRCRAMTTAQNSRAFAVAGEPPHKLQVLPLWQDNERTTLESFRCRRTTLTHDFRARALAGQPADKTPPLTSPPPAVAAAFAALSTRAAAPAALRGSSAARPGRADRASSRRGTSCRRAPRRAGTSANSA